MTHMARRPLGRSGITVSAVGLGCNNFGRPGSATETFEGTAAVLNRAIEVGVTFLDTADIYGAPAGTSETLMGLALKGRRDEVVIATKFGHDSYDIGIAPGTPKGSRAYIREAVEGSLRRLQVAHIDLYQQHSPDPHTPIDETIAALNELVGEGTIRAFGHSNFSAQQIRAADAAASSLGGEAFVSAQDEYSLLERGVERDVLPAARELGLAFLPYFPLHNGLLTGKFTRTERPADSRISRQRPQLADSAPWETIERYAALCAGYGVTMLEGTFGWLLAQPGLTSVIAGATLPEQVTQNAAAGEWVPDDTQVSAISAIFAE